MLSMSELIFVFKTMYESLCVSIKHGSFEEYQNYMDGKCLKKKKSKIFKRREEIFKLKKKIKCVPPAKKL